MSDFKQQVEEAIKDAIHDALPEEIIDLTDRILAAHNAELERIAGGCNKFKEKNANNVPHTNHAGNNQIDKCQSYIIGERGK